MKVREVFMKKKVSISRNFQESRKKCIERMNSEFGKKLRMNWSIQVEGSFANIKADMQIRRYRRKGKEFELKKAS